MSVEPVEYETVRRAREKPTWNERQCQDAVYIYCAIKQHQLIVPNSCLFAWESDVISVNKVGYIHEFEIKVSRADFRQDAKKERAKLLLNPIVRHDLWRGGIRETMLSRPNYFYYAVPEGLIEASEVPDYAGLIYLYKHAEGPELYYAITREIKAPKRLHRDKISEKQLAQLTRAVNRRYWRQRLKALSGPQL